MSRDFFRTEWVDWTFRRGSSWNDFILDCADTTEGQYCCFVVWTLDRSPSCIPAVNSIWEILHRLAVFLEYYLFHGWLNGTKRSPQSAKNPSASVPSGLLSVPLFYFSQLYEGSISFCSLSLSEGTQYTCRPSLYWHESIDIFVYVLYNITVNDW